MADKKENNAGNPAVNGQNPKEIITGSGLLRKNRRKYRLLIFVTAAAIIVVLAVLAPGYWKNYQQKQKDKRFEAGTQQLNNAYSSGDKAQAIEQAKRLLSENPDNIDSILAVANLLADEDPEEAKKYYIRAYEEYKKVENPDESGKSALVYWAAAGFAEDAGYIDEAKSYYKKVVEEANMVDGYEISLADQAKKALKRLN